MQEWITVKDVILFLVAIYGALLSTFNWRQTVRKERRSIEVKMSTVMSTFDNGNLGPPIARIDATNIGHRDVTIKTIALELPNNSRLFSTTPHNIPGMADTSLPIVLSDGQSAHLHFSYKDIGTALIENGRSGKIKITPVCENSVGEIYKGDPWKVDPAEYLHMAER